MPFVWVDVYCGDADSRKTCINMSHVVSFYYISETDLTAITTEKNTVWVKGDITGGLAKVLRSDARVTSL